MIELRALEASERRKWHEYSSSGYRQEVIRQLRLQPDVAASYAADESARILELPGYRLLGAFQDEQLVGFLQFILHWEYRDAYLLYIEVFEDHRGKGYSKAMMEELSLLARKEGCQTLRLHVFNDNIKARRLYTSSGYRATGTNMILDLGKGEN